MAVAEKNKLVVIDPEKSLDAKKLTNPEHFVFAIEVGAKNKEKRDAFLVLKASTLNKFADGIIAKALAMSNLRVVFVFMDDPKNIDRFFDKVQEQELNKPGLVKKLFKVTDDEQIDRILHSWCLKRAADTIASAYVDNDVLVLRACNLEPYRVKFEDFPGLAELSVGQRENFKIDKWGHDVQWPAQNVAIDLDVIRYNADDDFRKGKDMAALSLYQEFLAKAIEAVMAEHDLNQITLQEKGGPAPRHLFRILQEGQRLTPNMLDKLATAHGLTSKEYVEELVQACNEIVEEEADAIEEMEKRRSKSKG